MLREIIEIVICVMIGFWIGSLIIMIWDINKQQDEMDRIGREMLKSDYDDYYNVNKVTIDVSGLSHDEAVDVLKEYIEGM